MLFLSTFWHYKMAGFPLLFHKDFFIYYLYVHVLFVHLEQLFPSAEISSESEFYRPNLITMWSSVMLLCCKDAFFLGQLENTDCASLLLSLLLFPHPLIYMFWALWIFMFDLCLLQNTAAKWWGSSVISDFNKLRTVFLLDSAIEGSWVIFSCAPVIYVKGRMLTQNNRAGQSAPVLSRRKVFDKRRKCLFLAVENGLLHCGAQAFPRPSQCCSHECLVWLHCGVLWRCEKWARWLSCPICIFFSF